MVKVGYLSGFRRTGTDKFTFPQEFWTRCRPRKRQAAGLHQASPSPRDLPSPVSNRWSLEWKPNWGKDGFGDESMIKGFVSWLRMYIIFFYFRVYTLSIYLRRPHFAPDVKGRVNMESGVSQRRIELVLTGEHSHRCSPKIDCYWMRAWTTGVGY